MLYGCSVISTAPFETFQPFSKFLELRETTELLCPSLFLDKTECCFPLPQGLGDDTPFPPLTPQSPLCTAAGGHRPSGSLVHSGAPASPESGEALQGSGTGCCRPRDPTNQSITQRCLTSATHTLLQNRDKCYRKQVPSHWHQSFYLWLGWQ